MADKMEREAETLRPRILETTDAGEHFDDSERIEQDEAPQGPDDPGLAEHNVAKLKHMTELNNE